MYRVFAASLKICLASALILFLLTLYNSVYNPVKKGEYNHVDAGYEIDELLKIYGYPFENHTVVTEDGYLLQMHRIPHGKGNKHITNRPAIILQHGFTCSSTIFLSGNRENLLPYLLADNGYDVWMPNNRGNIYSRTHRTLDVYKDTKKFFHFSFHELAVYDLPASIDYVIEKTQQQKIFYAGHSQGSTIYFILMSEQPEYNEKIRLMLGLAPVVYTENSRAFFTWLPAMFYDTFKWMVELFDIHQFFPFHPVARQFFNRMCADGSLFQGLCVFGLGINGGFNDAQLDKAILPLFFSHFPAGASIKQLLHFSQVRNAGEFQQYDHGKENNIIKYGKETPPPYNLANAKAPVALIYGNNDWCTPEANINRLASRLPNLVLKHKVCDSDFSHMDFIFGENSKDVLHGVILDTLKKY